MCLDPDVEEDLPRAQERGAIFQVADTSGLLEKLPVKVPVVLSSGALISEELNGHHDLFLQNR